MATPQPYKTASTHRSAIARGAHQFDIVGYSTCRKLGADNTIRSRSFDAGGFAWALVCRFAANTTTTRGVTLASIALELSRNVTDEAVLTTASIRIDDSAGSGHFPAAEWRSAEAHAFPAWSRSAVSWELAVPDAFVKHEERYVIDDCLTIHCAIEVLREESTDGATRKYSVVVPPPPSLSHDISRLWEEMWWPDVTFSVDETKVQAHKLVLAARSPVFAAQFFHGDMKEKAMRRLRIDDMSASTFTAMLHFIYTDELPKPKEVACRVAMARDLLVAADLYDLERLRLMCENILAESIGVGNVMSTLMLLHGRHSCQHLEASCIEFMASDPDMYDAVQATEDYKELDTTCPSFIKEVTKKIATRAVARNRSSSSTSSSTEGGNNRGESASKYNPSAVMSGTHEFTIQSLSTVRKTHSVEEYITSGSFHVGGYDWVIEVFPSGLTEDTAEYIGIFARPSIDDDDTKVKASVNIKVVHPSGKLSPSRPRNFTHVYDGSDCSGQGWPKFITAESANSHYVGHDGSFIIRCRVEVTTVSCPSNANIANFAPVLVPPSNLARHLEQVLTSEEGWDMKFLVEGSEIHAHGLVIAARSPTLHQEVESATSTEHVRIDDVRAVVFKALLHFIYTDELPHINDLVRSLPAAEDSPLTAVVGEMLAAACRFRLERMKRLCENLLAENITTASALATLRIAGSHGCTELEGYCIEYISLPHVVKGVMKTLKSFVLE